MSKLDEFERLAEELSDRNKRCIKVLQMLYDVQNGCPLPKYKQEWDIAMEAANLLLSATPLEVDQTLLRHSPEAQPEEPGLVRVAAEAARGKRMTSKEWEAWVAEKDAIVYAEQYLKEIIADLAACEKERDEWKAMESEAQARAVGGKDTTHFYYRDVWQTEHDRAEAAERRVRELEEALGFAAYQLELYNPNDPLVMKLDAMLTVTVTTTRAAIDAAGGGGG